MSNKLFIIILSSLLIFTGCAANTEVIIDTNDVIVENGTNLTEQEVIYSAIKSVKVNGEVKEKISEQLKGFDYVDLNQNNSYKLTYDVCFRANVCSSEDFELNVVSDIDDPNALRDIRKVYLNAHNLIVPIDNQLSDQEIMDLIVFDIIDSEDLSFSKSLSIAGLDTVDWSTAGSYKIYIGGCDSELNCDETTAVITISDQVNNIEVDFV